MDEPIHVTNIKKAIVANLNMDISASRRAEINSNSIQVSFSNYYFSSMLAKFSNYDGFYFSKFQIPDEAVLEQAPLGQTYFSVREQSLHGIYYFRHPLIMYLFIVGNTFIFPQNTFFQVIVKLPILFTKFPHMKLWKLKRGCNAMRNTAVNENIFLEDSHK